MLYQIDQAEKRGDSDWRSAPASRLDAPAGTRLVPVRRYAKAHVTTAASGSEDVGLFRRFEDPSTPAGLLHCGNGPLHTLSTGDCILKVQGSSASSSMFAFTLSIWVLAATGPSAESDTQSVSPLNDSDRSGSPTPDHSRKTSRAFSP